MRSPSLLGMMALAIAPAVYATDAQEFLVRIGEAARGANYQGVIIYRGDDMLETMRVTHRFQNDIEHERVQSLTGAPREILKQDDKVICLLPKDRKLTSNLPTPKALFPTLSPERLQQIAQVYALEDLGTARVAGRNCRGLAVRPRDQFRYGYEIWADEKTSVPLKVSLVGRNNVVLEQMMFTEIEFPASIPDTAFQPQMPADQPHQVVHMVENPQQPAPPTVVGVQFDRLPPGYRVAFRDVRAIANGQGSVEHLLLSDGLSAISIFTTRREPREGAAKVTMQGVSQMGAVHAYRRMVGNFNVTVVGEAPLETVRLIGDGIRPAPMTPVVQAMPAANP